MIGKSSAPKITSVAVGSKSPSQEKASHKSRSPNPLAKTFEDEEFVEMNRGQLKKIYKNESSTHVLAFCQDANESQKLIEEVELLKKIAETGIKVPKARVVSVGSETAVLMDYINGDFIDIAKQPLNAIMKEILYSITIGLDIDPRTKEKKNTEMGKIIYGQEVLRKSAGKKIDDTAKAKLIVDLEKIYDARNETAINDLQIMLKTDGESTVIDPQMVASLEWYKTDGKSGELEFVTGIYEKLRNIIGMLKHIPSNSNVDMICRRL